MEQWECLTCARVCDATADDYCPTCGCLLPEATSTMNDPDCTRTVEKIIDIMSDLDEFGTPKVKLPDCPKCDEDELGVIHADLILCYRCGWKVESKISV